MPAMFPFQPSSVAIGSYSSAVMAVFQGVTDEPQLVQVPFTAAKFTFSPSTTSQVVPLLRI